MWMKPNPECANPCAIRHVYVEDMCDRSPRCEPEDVAPMDVGPKVVQTPDDPWGTGKWVNIGTTTGGPRFDLLTEARRIISEDRNTTYGEPLADFTRTAEMLTAMGYRFNNEALQGSDVALIMACLKLSRLAHGRGKKDSWLDLAGYAGCGWENADAEAQQSGQRDGTPGQPEEG